MKICFILLFSILVLPLFGQKKSFIINQPFFQIEEEVDGKFYAHSIIEGKIDTIIINNEIAIPKHTSEMVFHPEKINLTEVKIDTIYYESSNCMDNKIVTIAYYFLKKDQSRTYEMVYLRGEPKIPAYLSYDVMEKNDTFFKQINIHKTVFETVNESVMVSWKNDGRFIYKNDTIEIQNIPNPNCNQYYEVIIKKHYSGEEAWNENVITIDESTRKYGQEIHYRQENKLQRVEVLFPETKLIKTIQRKLKKANYYDGKITGKLDFETQTAILKYQQANGLPQGQLDSGLIDFMENSRN